VSNTNNNHEFNCVKNGCPIERPFEEAYKLFYTSHIGLLKPLEWMRWSISETTRELYLNRVVQNRARFFGFQLLMRGNSILTIDRYCKLRDVDGMERETFEQHKCQFCKVFNNMAEEAIPVENMREVQDTAESVSGYRIKPEYSVFIVLSTVSGEPFDWTEFLKPPE